MRLQLQSIELEVDGGTQLGQRRHERVIRGDAHAVGVDHHVRDASRLRRRDEIEDLRMDRRFAAAELDDFRIPFQLDQAIEHPLHLGQRQIEALPRVREADRAIEVAPGVDLDQRDADVLLVLRTETAIPRTPFANLGAPAERDAARLVEARRCDVCLGVGADQSLEPAMFRAAFAEIDPVGSQEHLGIDAAQADRADAAGELVEDLVRITSDLANCTILVTGYHVGPRSTSQSHRGARYSRQREMASGAAKCRHGDCKKLPSHQPSTPSDVATWYQAMPSPSTGPAMTVAV